MNYAEVYITDPSLVCKIKKSLYGLKQAPREWYSKMDSFLLSQKFQRCRSDTNVYLQQHDGNIIIIVLYSDDLLIIGSTVSSISAIKTALHNAFEMSDLGLEIEQNYDGIMVTQSKYISDLLVTTYLNVGLHHSLSFQGSALKKEKTHLPWTALSIDS